jgi:hypothetical protein
MSFFSGLGARLGKQFGGGGFGGQGGGFGGIGQFRGLGQQGGFGQQQGGPLGGGVFQRPGMGTEPYMPSPSPQPNMGGAKPMTGGEFQRPAGYGQVQTPPQLSPQGQQQLGEIEGMFGQPSPAWNEAPQMMKPQGGGGLPPGIVGQLSQLGGMGGQEQQPNARSPFDWFGQFQPWGR